MSIFLLVSLARGHDLSQNFDEVQVHYSKYPLPQKTDRPEQRFVSFRNQPHEQRIVSPNLGHYVSNTQFMDPAVIHEPNKMPYISEAEKTPYPGMWIRFDPPYLDFGPTSLGQEVRRTVTILNLHKDDVVEITSIQSPNAYFAATGISSNKIGPSESATFDVVFVPRKLGNVEQTLFIATKSSKLKFPIFGVGTSNPYRLPPFLAARIPLNASRNYKMSIYNPEEFPLQITEIYASSPRVQLKLGDQRISKQQLIIQPYEEKVVATATFLGRLPGDQSAFIRLMANRHCDAKKPLKLIIPFDIEVAAVASLHATDWLMDFGIVHKSMESVDLPLNLINTGNKAREVEVNWIRQLPVTQSYIKIDISHSKKIPVRQNSTSLGKVSFLYEDALATGKTFFNGVFRIHVSRPNPNSEEYRDLEIPWQARILIGDLEIQQEQLKFLLSEIRETQQKTRNIEITNNMEEPVYIHRIEVGEEGKNHFGITYNKDLPCLLTPKEKSELFEIELIACAEQNGKMDCPEDNIIETKIHIYTNASTFHYDLMYYYGLVNYQVSIIDPAINENPKIIDFGLTNVGDQKCQIIMLANKNPIDIALERYHIEDMQTSGTTFAIWPMSSFHFGRTEISHRKSEPDFPLILKKNSTSIFECCMGVMFEQRFIDGTIALESHFQVIRIPFTGRWFDGTMKIMDTPLKFPPNFPGKTVSAEVSMYSTFKEGLDVSSVIPQVPGIIRFIPNGKHVHAMTKTVIGKLEFDGKQSCDGDFYTQCSCIGSLQPNNKCGQAWMDSLDRPHQSAKQDAQLYAQFRKSFLNYNTEINPAVTIMTTANVNYDFEFKPKLKWPRLAQVHTQDAFLQHPILFAQTAVTTPLNRIQAQRMIKISNPSDDWVQFQPILLGDIQQNYKLENALKDDYPYLNPKNHTEKFSYSPDFAVVHHNNSFPRPLIPPRSEVKVTLRFIPRYVGTHEAVLVLRNNLTILEPIRLVGKGVKEEIKLKDGNIFFTMLFRDDDLKDCYNTKPGDLPFRKASKTTLLLENFSVVPSNIVRVIINGANCASDGWEVADCNISKNGQLKDGHMPPHGDHPAYKEIKLKYRPDFSMLETHALLDIYTEFGGKFRFSLQSRVPEDHIGACRASIPRPSWENGCRRIIVVMMWLLLGGIIVMGYIEANCVRSEFIEKFAKTTLVPHTVIDQICFKLYSHLQRKRPEAKVAPTPNTTAPAPKPRIQFLSNEDVKKIIEENERKEKANSPNPPPSPTLNKEKQDSITEWGDHTDASKQEPGDQANPPKSIEEEMGYNRKPTKKERSKKTKTSNNKKGSRSGSFSSTASSNPPPKPKAKPVMPVEDIQVFDSSTDSSSGHELLPPSISSTKTFLTREHIRSVKLSDNDSFNRSSAPPKPDSDNDDSSYDPFGLSSLSRNVKDAIQRQDTAALSSRSFDPTPGRKPNHPRSSGHNPYQNPYDDHHDSYYDRYKRSRYEDQHLRQRFVDHTEPRYRMPETYGSSFNETFTDRYPPPPTIPPPVQAAPVYERRPPPGFSNTMINNPTTTAKRPVFGQDRGQMFGLSSEEQRRKLLEEAGDRYKLRGIWENN